MRMCVNPIALRTAKTLKSFGCFECNRVIDSDFQGCVAGLLQSICLCVLCRERVLNYCDSLHDLNFYMTNTMKSSMTKL